jgi:hypothetical protein
MSASKKRSAADFLPKTTPAPDAEAMATVAEVISEHKDVIDALAEAEMAETVPEVLEPELLSDPEVVKALLAEIQGLRKQVGALSKSQARIIEETSDLTDDLWFITKPGGKRSHKKAIVRGPTGQAMRIMVEDIRTSFIGPFQSEADVRTYLAAKAKARHDSVIDWSLCDVMQGKDAREIERAEERKFVKAYGDNPEEASNILERRVRPMFDNAAQHEKRGLGLADGVGKATQEVRTPRVQIRKMADGTETLDIRDAG